AAVLSLTALGVLSGCGGSSSTAITNNPNPNPPQVTRGQYGPLQFTLSTTKTVFAVGETVPFVFTITNTGSETVSGFAGDRFGRESGDLIGADILRDGARIWTKDGLTLGGTGSLSRVSFNPGESRRFEFSWSQKGNDLVFFPLEGFVGLYRNVEGPQVAPGTYSIDARAGFSLESVTDQNQNPQAPAPMNMNITIR
ncbi:MAG: hypothetical protein V4671_32050, partial [Armatimonadota bacterium]